MEILDLNVGFAKHLIISGRQWTFLQGMSCDRITSRVTYNLASSFTNINTVHRRDVFVSTAVSRLTENCATVVLCTTNDLTCPRFWGSQWPQNVYALSKRKDCSWAILSLNHALGQSLPKLYSTLYTAFKSGSVDCSAVLNAGIVPVETKIPQAHYLLNQEISLIWRL